MNTCVFKKYNDYPVVPWRNGGGVTRDIFKSVEDEQGFVWRLSLADVGQSGAFSSFAGYERTITLLEGAGFSLNFEDGQSKSLDDLHDPYVFDGGASLDCQLIDGLSKDLNLMVRYDTMKMQRHILDISENQVLRLKANSIHLFFCFEGEFRMDETYDFKKWDCATYEPVEDCDIKLGPVTSAKIFHIILG